MHSRPPVTPLRFSPRLPPPCSGASGAATTGAPACFQINGPCPNATAGAPAAAYLAGQVATVSMLKNLDHYNDASPGNFSAFLWNAKGVSQFLGAYPDTSAPSNSLYNLPVTIPAGACACAVGNLLLLPALQCVRVESRPHSPIIISPPCLTPTAGTPALSADAPSGSYVLQTIYFADHAGAPAAFYQCSDGACVGAACRTSSDWEYVNSFKHVYTSTSPLARVQCKCCEVAARSIVMMKTNSRIMAVSHWCHARRRRRPAAHRLP